MEGELANKNPHRYKGRYGYYYDTDAELYLLYSRWCNPGIRRFMTRDEYRGEVANPISMHRYAYCGNDPVGTNAMIATINGGGGLIPWELTSSSKNSTAIINRGISYFLWEGLLISILIIITIPVLYTANRLVILAVNRKMTERNYTTGDPRKTFTLFDKKALIVLSVFMVLMIVIYTSGEEDLMQFIAGVILVPNLWDFGSNLSYLFRLYFSLANDRDLKVDKRSTIRMRHSGELGFLVPLASITLITNHPLVGGGFFYLTFKLIGAWRKLKKVSNSNISD